MRAAALLARLRRVHRLRALHEQVLQLERLDQVGVPYLVGVRVRVRARVRAGLGVGSAVGSGVGSGLGLGLGLGSGLGLGQG